MVNGPPERALADLLLRLLLGDRRVMPGETQWGPLLVMAKANRVLLRLEARLHQHPARPPLAFVQAVTDARSRAQSVLGLVARIGATGEQRELPHVFLNVAQEYPDVAGELDLLVLGRSPAVDARLLDHIPALPGRRGLRGRFAGRITYAMPEHESNLHVHHGRLGSLGELSRFAELVLRRRRCVRLGTAACFVPSAEDQLLNQAVCHGAFRRALPLGEAYTTMALVRGGLNWAPLVAAAEATGLLPALSRHLTYADQIHREVMATPLLEPATGGRLLRRSWGEVTFRRGAYRPPMPRIRGSLYLEQMRASVATGDWAAIARLCLLPIAALPGKGPIGTPRHWRS